MPVAFDEVVDKVTDAARQVQGDGGASPVLVAVVRSFTPSSRRPRRERPTASLLTIP